MVALGLSRRALEIAEEVNEEGRNVNRLESGLKSNISGREACYLLAITYRINITRPKKGRQKDVNLSSFERAREFIDRAHNCLQEDKSNGSANSLSGSRFDAEYLAIEITEMHYKIWFDIDSDSILVSAAEDIISKCSELVDRIDLEIAQIKGDDKLYSKNSSKINLMINLAQAFHIYVYLIGFEDDQRNYNLSQSHVKLATKTLDSLNETANLCEYHESYVTAAYLMLLKLMTGRTKLNSSEIDEYFSKEKIREYSVMSYDGRRYSNLRALCHFLASRL